MRRKWTPLQKSSGTLLLVVYNSAGEWRHNGLAGRKLRIVGIGTRIQHLNLNLIVDGTNRIWEHILLSPLQVLMYRTCLRLKLR